MDEDEEEGNFCLICNLVEREDVLLFCDSCDVVYYIYCIGFEEILVGDWYCMECVYFFYFIEDFWDFDIVMLDVLWFC